MNVEDATNLLIQFLRDPDHGMMSSYGYDIYVPNLHRKYLQSQGVQHQELEAN